MSAHGEPKPWWIPMPFAWGGGVVLVLGLTFSLFSSTALDQTADPAAVFLSFIDTRNRGDVDGALALMTDDIRLVGGPRCTEAAPCIGKEAVRADVQNYIPTYHVQATPVDSPQVSGTTVRARLAVRSDDSRAAGVDRFINNATVEMRDGKIASFRVVPDVSDPQTAQYLVYQRAQAGAPSMPRTGAGGVVSPLPPDWVALLIVGGLVAGGWGARRTRRGR